MQLEVLNVLACVENFFNYLEALNLWKHPSNLWGQFDVRLVCLPPTTGGWIFRENPLTLVLHACMPAWLLGVKRLTGVGCWGSRLYATTQVTPVRKSPTLSDVTLTNFINPCAEEGRVSNAINLAWQGKGLTNIDSGGCCSMNVRAWKYMCGWLCDRWLIGAQCNSKRH